MYISTLQKKSKLYNNFDDYCLSANLWITPAFRHKKYVQKSVVLLLSWLFNSGNERYKMNYLLS